MTPRWGVVSYNTDPRDLIRDLSSREAHNSRRISTQSSAPSCPMRHRRGSGIPASGRVLTVVASDGHLTGRTRAGWGVRFVPRHAAAGWQ